MICCGVESTAHTFGVGLVSDSGEILFDSKDTYRDPDGGLHPGKASDHHANVAADLVKQALTVGKPDLVAFSAGPGLGPCLRIGAVVARTISHKFKVPLIGVNHCIAHIEIARLTTGAKDPVTVYLSGGNSQVLAYVGGRYRAIGETLDIAVGNALDKFAREAGLKGAPDIEKLASRGSRLLDLPYTVKGMDLSFAGIITHAAKMLGKEPLEDICFSLQEYMFAMLTEVTERALAALNKKEMLLTGGVAANKRLQSMLRAMVEERGGEFWAVDPKYAGDNGVMIAWTGILMHRYKCPGLLKVRQKWRPDEVDVPWVTTG